MKRTNSLIVTILVALTGLGIGTALSFQPALQQHILPIQGPVASVLPAPGLKSAVEETFEKVQEPAPAPAKLVIPKLGVETTVELVGLDEQKRMDVPDDYANVGWYQLGPHPGEPGSAVIAGHLDSPTGPAVFYRLNTLQKGDTVTVVDEDGQEQEFEVIETATYKEDAFPIETVFKLDGEARLNLITCAGTFNRADKNYSDRFVVFTIPK